MNKTSILFVLLCMLFVVCCNQKEESNTLPANWSTYKPETIPYRIRQQNFERGNVIPNSSFESGKLYGIENDQEAFNAPGWRRSGENVYWVNINDTLFDSSEVSTGIHAIKIIREKYDETEDAGEGVISDFIKVIPGHYNLSLDIRLKNIRSSKSRLGTKLYDAIDIRVIYYDKNKIEISPNQYSNHYQTKINASNKWLSFAHFNKIDSLNWTTVFCESAYPPFPDGYIPDETRFIKIFIGLKGSGIMWVDNINYYYTNDNFSLQERLQPLFMNEFDVYDLILPTPQKISKKNKINLVSDSIEKKVLIISPEYSSIRSSLEFKQLKEKLTKYEPTLKSTLTLKDISQYNLIFSIGNTEIFNKTYSDSVFSEIHKNNEQSYIIKSVENFPNIVFIASKSELGLQYGVNTTIQLVDTIDNIFYNANISDWPDLKKRSVTLNSEIGENKLEELITDLRYNIIFSKNIPDNPSLIDYHGFILDDKQIEQKNKGTYQTGSTLLINTKLAPKTRIDYSNKEIIWYCSDCSDLEKLHQNNLEEQKTFHHTNNLELNAIMWKGTSTYSPYIDYLDYMNFKKYTTNPVVLSLNLFDFPFEIPINRNNLLSLPNFKISGTIFENIQHINFEVDSLALANQLKIRAMAYYSWNTKDYNSDEILYKILVKNISHEGDIYKLISLSDKFKTLQWNNYINKNKTNEGDQGEYYELVNNYRFEDKKLNNLILNYIGLTAQN